MKVIVEILKKKQRVYGEAWVVQKSKTVQIDTIINEQVKQRAKTKLQELQSSLSTDEKIRVLEYHNDDSDNVRTACKILFEA